MTLESKIKKEFLLRGVKSELITIEDGCDYVAFTPFIKDTEIPAAVSFVMNKMERTNQLIMFKIVELTPVKPGPKVKAIAFK